MVVPGGCAAGAELADACRASTLTLRGAFFVHVARGDLEARHRRDRRQRFAAEPERGDGAEIVGAGDLAGGVARQRERQLGGGNSAAVVAHAREPHAARFDLDFDALRAGVEAVLDQLLDDGCGALDDLAGRDLIDEVIVEDADRHGRAV